MLPRRCPLTYFIPLSDVGQPASHRPAFGACGFHVMGSHAGLGYAVIANDNICMANLMRTNRPPAEVCCQSKHILRCWGFGSHRVSHHFILRHTGTTGKMPSPLTPNDTLLYALCGR
jgi:hypothetical protein